MKTDIRALVGIIPHDLLWEFMEMEQCTIPKDAGAGKLRCEFVAALNREIDEIREGKFPGATDKPLVDTPVMSLMWKHKVDGRMRINKFIRWPEMEEAVDKLEGMFKATLTTHLERTKDIDSKMPYKRQYLLEEIIGRVKGWEDSV